MKRALLHLNTFGWGCIVGARLLRSMDAAAERRIARAQLREVVATMRASIGRAP